MTGPNPTDRAKLGTKRHLLTDGQGIPLSVVITAANTHDMKAATNTLDNIVVKRPYSKINKERQNLCLDKGYDFLEIENSVIKKGYCPHNRFRKLLVRYEKKTENYFELVCLGCCILIYRRIILG
jgi:putative transposase